MRKFNKVFAFLMAVTMGTIALASCGSGTNYETNETKAFKEVVDLLAQNRGKSNKKGYELKFNQDFTYEEKEESAKIVADYKAHYVSSGTVLLSYTADAATDVSIETGFDSFVQKGTGFISGVQSEKHEITNEETNADTKEIVRKENHNYGVDNKFVYDTDATNIAMMSETSYINYNDNTKTVNDKFYGKINKSTLLDAINSTKIDETLNTIMFIDVWNSMNTLLKLVYDNYKAIDTNSYESLYKYIENKNFKYERTNNSIIIKYVIDVDQNLKETENKFENVEMNLEVDTTTKEILNFKFDLTKYLTSVLKTEDTPNNEFKSNVNTYVIEGKILNNTLTRTDTSNINYTEYNEETKYDFVDGLLNHALPIREDVYE